MWDDGDDCDDMLVYHNLGASSKNSFTCSTYSDLVIIRRIPKDYREKVRAWKEKQKLEFKIRGC